MLMIDVQPELIFKTARSSGPGGQNVNKTETQVEALWHLFSSSLVSDEQKQILKKKLASRLDKEGFLHAKSQTSRSQLQNKENAIQKMNLIIGEALKPRKRRKATGPTIASKRARLQKKKERGQIKSLRKRVYKDEE